MKAYQSLCEQLGYKTHDKGNIRVGLTCDFLRFVPKESAFLNIQNQNLAWLAELLIYPLTKVLDVSLTKIYAPEDPDAFRLSFGKDDVPVEYFNDPGMAWAKQYDTENCELFPPLLDLLLQQDLIIGFEIPPTIKRYLHKNNKKYLNIYIHPIRYLRDLCFGVNTNCTELSQIINEFEVDKHEIINQTRRFRALFAKQHLPVCSFPAGIPLIIGQTDRDSVLITNGVFTDWPDYKNELNNLLATYDTVIFLGHPCRKDNLDTIEFFNKELQKNVLETRGNNYGTIFSNNELPLVLTLASSFGVEATTVGYENHYLLSDPRTKFLVPEVDQPDSSMIGHAIIDTKFWAAIFEQSKPENNNNYNEVFFLGDHYLRNSLESWSYKVIMHELIVEKGIRRLYPAAKANKELINRIAMKCCGILNTDNFSLEEMIVIAKNNGIDFDIIEDIYGTN